MVGIYKAIVCFLVAWPAVAQSQAFEKIVIKPVHSADPRSERVQVIPNGDLKAKAVSVITLLSYAYDVPANPSPRLLSLPGWTIDEMYDIEINAHTTITAFSEDSETQSQTKQMIRRLLADRFKLVMRVENKRMPVYALTVSSSGPKLQQSAISAKNCIFDSDPDGCHNFVAGFGHPLIAKAISIDDLAHYIENWTDLPVVNRTQLGGLFTVDAQGWLPIRLPPPPPGAAPNPDMFASLPTIFTVLGTLGLELHRQEETLPVYTVEHIERPAAD
jgi:uncharacterized protein (TIGR03435 family)